MPESFVCVAKIFAAHGIKGAVKIRSFTEDPLSITQYSPLFNKDGSVEYILKILSCNQDVIIAHIQGVKDRNEAEALRGKELYAIKNDFADIDEDEFFYEDLVGLKVNLQDGDEYGEIISMQNYGAGDIVEIKLKDSVKTELFAFTKDMFPTINITDGYAVIIPPEIENIE